MEQGQIPPDEGNDERPVFESEYLVHFNYDDATTRRRDRTERRGTPGRMRTDHPYEKGDLIYGRNGRAFVRSCRLDRTNGTPLATDDTYRRNARTLRSLSRNHGENT